MKSISQDRGTYKNRNEPGRFFGDGVSFKAKLIGILEVGEARGDRMCQEALQDLKMAIRAAGEHKQRITIHVTIDGLRLRDEKTGDSLYHHPVHKISFIAQDMSDSRAFGYIFGSPDSGHRFFGIKTDKAASQVVLAMRDLFQVVFELKKKEIELARQHIQSKITAHEHQAVAMSVKSSNADGYGKTLTSDGASSSLAGSSSASGSKTMAKSEKSPESVADLVDLEQELSSIQRGITQMERITPNEVPSKSVIDDDPFGDSFTNMPPAYNLLPPPESSKRHQKQTHRSTENIPATESSPVPVVSSSPPSSAAPPVPTAQTVTIPPPQQPKSSTPGPTGPTITTSNSNQNDDWLNSPPNTSRFDPDPVKYSDELNLKDLDEGFKSLTSAPQPSSYTDVFTDLDPLGTGKIKPYVDKKYFFQELKNPPKKVLRDLSGTDSTFNANFTSEDLERQSPSTIPQASTNAASTVGSNDLFKPSFDDNMAMSKEQTSEFSDPFTNRTADPFMEDDDFSKLHIDPFELHFSRTTSPGQTNSKPTDDGKSKPEDGGIPGDSPVTYNGPLQVNLPPESWASYISQKRMERQNSDTIPPPGAGITSTARNRPNVFKQNTVDVISSISSSSKKMKPNLFGQKFSKRDSNSINMRRLQESDSLSENETAPEPPPRPDHTGSHHIEPPPLPPKKQFADIVIRPTPRSGSNISSGALGSGGSTKERYDYVGAKFEAKNQSTSDNAPPLPLPSRKVNRGDGTSPGRPFKKLNEEDDYLQPIPAKSDIPTLLPPPQRKDASKTRAARKSETDPRNLDEQTPPAHIKSPTSREKESLLPDITLSQLLTLGIDELANKLNVPVSKLNTMTLVELTSYLSEFIENSKTSPSSAASLNQDADNNDSPVFKVNFDDHNDATFVAKFDDNFGEDNTFVANFDSMNLPPAQSSPRPAQVSAGPTIDKYAVFREIIEQDIGPSQEPQKPEQEKSGSDFATLDFDKEVASEMNRLSPNITGDHFATSPSQSQTFADASPVTVPMTKIDTKITEVISQAKDRYAALRDIILVEDLFEKPNPPPKTAAPIARMESSSFEDRDTEDEHKFEANFDDMPQVENHSPEINISDADINDEFGQPPESRDRSLHGLEPPESQNLSFRNTPKEDLEIDAFMQKAVSNLSLHSTGQQSPAPNQSAGGLTVKSPQFHTSSTSPNRLQQSRSPATASMVQNASVENLARTTTLNDMSTSPIPPAAKSPAARSPILKQPSSSSPHAKSPMDGSFDAEGPVGSTVKKIPTRSSGSISEGGESSPEADRNQDLKSSKLTPTNESWAVFDQPEQAPLPKKHEGGRVNKGVDKNGPESPCSSDPKEEWKDGREYGGRRWPAKGHTSSSSRDVSPWDEEGPEYRKRPSGGHHPPTSGERYHHPRMPPRRINSNDEDYEDDMKDRGERRRRMKGGQMSSRSRDNFDDEHWYHEHQGWSPEEDERPDRSRSFDRNAYERSTYGPPYEKREPKSLPQYDRRDYKNYDKRKYYRDRGRPNYDYDPYVEGYEQRMMKGRVDYEDVYERGPRDSRAAREYFYERERKSFDRDSNESYERRSFGSGDIYGSLDSRGDYRERDRYLSLDKTRSLRRGVRNAGSARLDDPEQDSEGDLMGGGGRRGDTNSLHRSSQNIRGKHQQIVDDEVWGVSMGGKPGWKRPSSATEQERRYNESRRMLANTSLAGSDGEKDRRFRKKSRNRSKDSDIRPGYATMRYPPRTKEDYFDFEADSREGGGGGGDGAYDNDEEEDVRGGKMMGENMDESPSYYGRRPLPPYYKPTTPRSESRTLNDSLIAQEAKKMARYEYEEEAMRRMKKSNSRDLYFEGEDKERFSGKFGSGNFDTVTPPKSAKHVRMEFEFEDFGETPQSNTSSKFNFEGGDGFESDFNSPPAPPSGNPPPSSHHSTTKSFRFSNDFSEKDPGRHYASYHQKNAPQSYGGGGGGGGGFEADFAATPRAGPTAQTAAKLRFNEQVTVSKFNSEANTAGTHMFEDDFAGRSDNELEDQWTCELQAPATSNNNGGKKILKSSSQNQQQQDNLRKSDSVNIFAKKVDDPFEDDDFFSSGGGGGGPGGQGEKDPFGGGAGTVEGGGESAGNAGGGGQQSGWDKNFANFDDNI